MQQQLAADEGSGRTTTKRTRSRVPAMIPTESMDVAHTDRSASAIQIRVRIDHWSIWTAEDSIRTEARPAQQQQSSH